MSPAPTKLDAEALSIGVLAGDRALLGRAITLVESQREDHRQVAEALLQRLAAAGRTEPSIRVGITGVPGAGKSTFIEALGCRLVDQGRRVAVLAVDPTSSRSRGSILGDKTRMTELARSPAAFVRPTPTGGMAGGVAARTREAMLVCEAAGFDVVLIETVGVGQTETQVAGMVDFVLLLALPGGGDELQGIKRGILELVDLVAIHKADGDNTVPARRARAELAAALRYVRPASESWQPPVLTASSLEGSGLDACWRAIEDHRAQRMVSSAFLERRRQQRIDWLWSLLDDGLRRAFRGHPRVAGELARVEADVLAGRASPAAMARHLVERFLSADGEPR